MARSPPHHDALFGELVEFRIQQRLPFVLVAGGSLLFRREASHLPHRAADDAHSRQLEADLGIPVRQKINGAIEDHAEEYEHRRQDGGEGQRQVGEVPVVTIREPRLALVVVQDVRQGGDDGIGSRSGREPQRERPRGRAGHSQDELRRGGLQAQSKGIVRELRSRRSDLGSFVAQALLLQLAERVGGRFDLVYWRGLEFDGI
mmetsp:Transcript_11367/g.27972  ORF Transcript_11367/g.27972 Transcript_11367/m.27972 type:complete len:203 (+) Transcript_11367:474-1082(+)